MSEVFVLYLTKSKRWELRQRMKTVPWDYTPIWSCTASSRDDARAAWYRWAHAQTREFPPAFSRDRAY